jgi:hypothetical protein
MELAIQALQIGTIELHWSNWTPWAKVEGKAVPHAPGVYEVRRVGEEGGLALTIGKASDLHQRVLRSLIRGQYPHSAGERIRREEAPSILIVRWAETDRPAAAEEELHRLHLMEFGRLPIYTLSTR